MGPECGDVASGIPGQQGCGVGAEDRAAGLSVLQCSGQGKVLEAVGGQGGHLAERQRLSQFKGVGSVFSGGWLWLCCGVQGEASLARTRGQCAVDVGTVSSGA